MAIAIEQNIGRLEITMDELGTMEKLNPLNDLINNESVVYILQDFLPELVGIYPMALWRSASMN